MKQLILMLALLPTYLCAQITTAGWGKPDDLKELSQRPLIVELLDESSNYAVADEEDLGPIVSSYNTGIQAAIAEYFHWNKAQQVRFMPTKEMNAFLESADPSTYATFRFHEEGDHMGYVEKLPGGNYSIDRGKSGYIFHQLLYSGPDRNPKKQDFTGFLPGIWDGDDGFRQFDMNMAVYLIQTMMQEYVDTGKKTYTSKYLKGLSKELCKASNSYTLHVDKAQLEEDVDAAALKKALGANVKLADAKLDMAAISTLKQGDAVMVSIPFDVLDAGGYAAKLYAKLVVDPTTMEILSESGARQATKPFDNGLNSKDLHTLAKCL